MKREANPDVKYIPKNYEIGVNLLGFNFKLRFLIEGTIAALIIFIIVFVILNYFNIEFATKIGYSIAFALIGLLLGIRGINDEPLTEFIGHYFKYIKRKRTAFYNPRVKKEIKPYLEQIQNNKNADVFETARSIYNKYKHKIEKNNQLKTMEYQNQNVFDKENMFFEDDIGVINKPYEYMTKKERKIYDKKHKKERGN